MIGIYKITNNINQKSYIGQSNFIERRFAQHKSPYEQNRFADKPLYRAFKEYGLENFTFEIIEECSVEELDEKEEYWINYYDSLVHHNGYNIRSGGDIGLSFEMLRKLVSRTGISDFSKSSYIL